MSSGCRHHALRILFCEGDAAGFDQELAEHVAGCTECSGVVARIGRQVAALRALERRTAPAELDGRVVAACHAGHREERVAAALTSLRHRKAPRELGPIVFGSDSVVAPRALDDRVDSDLARPEDVAARRAAARLERLRAPRRLRAQVERTIARGRAGGGARPKVWTSLVLGFVALAGIGLYFARGRGGSAPAPTYRFEVEYATSLDAFDPLARSLLASVSGGLTSLPQSGPDSSPPIGGKR